MKITNGFYVLPCGIISKSSTYLNFSWQTIWSKGCNKLHNSWTTSFEKRYRLKSLSSFKFSNGFILSIWFLRKCISSSKGHIITDNIKTCMNMQHQQKYLKWYKIYTITVLRPSVIIFDWQRRCCWLNSNSMRSIWQKLNRLCYNKASVRRNKCLQTLLS